MIYVAECNLGKVKLNTMLASCLSLEFTRAAVGLSQGASGILLHITLRSSHFARVALCVRSLVFISAPFPALPLVNIG